MTRILRTQSANTFSKHRANAVCVFFPTTLQKTHFCADFAHTFGAHFRRTRPVYTLRTLPAHTLGPLCAHLAPTLRIFCRRPFVRTSRTCRALFAHASGAHSFHAVSAHFSRTFSSLSADTFPEDLPRAICAEFLLIFCARSFYISRALCYHSADTYLAHLAHSVRGCPAHFPRAARRLPAHFGRTSRALHGSFPPHFGRNLRASSGDVSRPFSAQTLLILRAHSFRRNFQRASE